MDPSHNEFNGSGLPPQRLQSQDQGPPQQLTGFSFQQFQNQLSSFNGLDRNSHGQLQREIRHELMLRQEIERRNMALNERNEIMNQLQNGDSALHHQLSNLQASAGHMFLSNEEKLQLQRAAQRQSVQAAAVQQALLQQQREMQQQQELQELQDLQQKEIQEHLQLQELLLSRMNNDTSSYSSNHDLEMSNQVRENVRALKQQSEQLKKRKRSASSSSTGTRPSTSKQGNPKKNNTKKKRTGEKTDVKPKSQKSQKKSKRPKNVDKVIDSGKDAVQEKIPDTKQDDSTTQAVTESSSQGLSVPESVFLNGAAPVEGHQSDSQGINMPLAENEDILMKSDECSRSVDVQVEHEIPEPNGFKNFSQNDNLRMLLQVANAEDNMEIENENIDASSDTNENDASQVDGIEILLEATKPIQGAYTDEEAVHLMTIFKEMAHKDPATKPFFGVPDLEQVEISPGCIATVPKLPEEPEFSEEEAERLRQLAENSLEIVNESGSSQLLPPEAARRDVKIPVFMDNSPKEVKAFYDNQTIDHWFPTSASIRRQRKAEGRNASDGVEVKLPNNGTIFISEELKKRLSNEVEPGVLEKMPHCKLHQQSFVKQYGKPPKDPLFCCQVTEVYCQSTMLCCSICSTWRHAECGGHYTKYSPKSSEAEFTPICEQCHIEKEILDQYPVAVKRLGRQRSIKQRMVQAVAAIMRNAAYAKHGGTYKWPLGSVSLSHIGGHTKSIHLRHERAEKQWKEMAAKLNNPNHVKLNKLRARTRDFERLMVNLEDAEGQTDRHNMTLFLQWDTSREYPVGFENPCLNFFDPAEDDQNEQHFFNDDMIDEDNGDIEEDDDQSIDGNKSIHSPSSPIPVNHEENSGRIFSRSAKKKRLSPKKGSDSVCLRPLCKKKPRFDSTFCSDACGILTMEKDLLYSLQYASNDMHPYQLRP